MSRKKTTTQILLQMTILMSANLVHIMTLLKPRTIANKYGKSRSRETRNLFSPQLCTGCLRILLWSSMAFNSACPRCDEWTILLLLTFLFLSL